MHRLYRLLVWVSVALTFPTIAPSPPTAFAFYPADTSDRTPSNPGSAWSAWWNCPTERFDLTSLTSTTSALVKLPPAQCKAICRSRIDELYTLVDTPMSEHLWARIIWLYHASGHNAIRIGAESNEEYLVQMPCTSKEDFYIVGDEVTYSMLNEDCMFLWVRAKNTAQKRWEYLGAENPWILPVR